MTNSPIAIEQIPHCLKDLDQWVCWKWIERAGNQTKCPVHPKFGWNASTSDPNTWTNFTDAVAAAPRYAGIGFVFSETDPFAGVDLDDCLDEQGQLLWGHDLLSMLDTYSEVSPSGRGLKLILLGKKPSGAKCKAKWRGQGEIEVYDKRRMFAVTGQRLDGWNGEVMVRQTELDALCAELWPAPALKPALPSTSNQKCLEAMLRMRLVDHSDGSHRLYSACCRAVEHGLSDADSLACLREYERQQPFPKPWSDAEIINRLRDAAKVVERGAAKPTPLLTANPIPVCDLVTQYTELRRPVIHGLLRQGETMNVIATPKVGKSFFATDLALALGAGRKWFDVFDTEPSSTLVIDNELHRETSASRIVKVAAARGIALPEVARMVWVENLRGRLVDIFAMSEYFASIEPGTYQVIVLDALYRFMPSDGDENSNGLMARIYNAIDNYAERLGCSFVLIHHSTKGLQSGKAITDVGAGAGSQSRAADAHLVLRQHKEPNCAVLDAALRSWPPIAPRVLRWQFPIWVPDNNLDPADLLQIPMPKRKWQHDDESKPKPPRWTAERFVEAFLTTTPTPQLAILDAADEAGVSERRAAKLLRMAEQRGLVHRWERDRKTGVEFAIEPMPETKRDEVRVLLAAEPKISNRHAAERLGVSHTLVGQVRREISSVETPVESGN